ncbi:MAG: hypothetical protein KGJ70_09715, partial [Gemmatimonadota bacterium]|nr:hypothetical protein [Gemmatimonadota bacterium]
ALVGSGAGCLVGPTLTVGGVASPTAGGTAFATAPRPGDTIFVFDDSRSPPAWRASRLLSVDAGGVACPLLGAGDVQTLRLEAGLDAAPAVAFRVLRRTRFSLYRSGDGSWYLGMRDWNLAGGGFTGIQPVAGPLAPFNRDPGRAGLHFAFVDAGERTGSPPPPPPPPGAPLAGDPAVGGRALRISARASGGADSAFRIVGIPRAPAPTPTPIP